jgi:hypothetical protein
MTGDDRQKEQKSMVDVNERMEVMLVIHYIGNLHITDSMNHLLHVWSSKLQQDVIQRTYESRNAANQV